jgi:uncharacterized Zn-finger protein
MDGHMTRPRGKPRKCAYCERVFTKEEHLKRHERTRKLLHDIIEAHYQQPKTQARSLSSATNAVEVMPEG